MRKVYYIRRPRPSVRVKPSFSRGELTNEAGIGAMDSASAAPLTLASSLIPRPFALGGLKADNEFLSDSAPATPKKGEANSPAVARRPAPAPQTAGTPAQAQPPAASAMESDQRFQGVTSRLEVLAGRERYHQPLRDKMTQAEQATRQPENEPVAEGEHCHVKEMSEVKEHPAQGPAHEESFSKVLKASLKEISPESKSDMEDLEENQTRKDKALQPIREGVQAQRNESEEELASAARHLAPKGGIKTDTPDIPELPRRGAPLQVNVQDALPLPKSEEEIAFEEDKKAADDAISKTSLTEEELAESNEPSFKAVVTERDRILGACAADTAKYQQDEAEFLKRSSKEATAEENRTREKMRHGSAGRHSSVRGRQEQLARTNNEERQRIASEMQLVYVSKKLIVDSKLASLEPIVNDMFTRSFNILFEVLQQDVHDDLEAWEDKRHSGLFSGTYRFWRDKVWGTSNLKEAIDIYCHARCKFETHMQIVFKRIAKFVDDTLAECTKAIEEGNRMLDDLVKNERDPQLKKFAAETASGIKGDFGFLQQSVEEQKNDLAKSLAARYKNSRATVDTWIAEDKKKHQGWARDLRDKAKEIYDIAVNFKDKLMGVLKRGVSIIMSIIRHPIRFLENLIASVKQGIHQFKERIGERLREAALTWLFGEIPASEIHAPKDLSPASIFGLVLELLGLTPQHFRERAARIVGENNVALFQRVMGYLDKYFNEGPAALWDELKSMLSGLKETIVDGVRDWVLTQVIKRGITQLALMFNPVGAFIEACIAIYNLIVFFIDHARQIADMLGGILDSVEDMVDGKFDAAANRIEEAMTRAVSFILGFLTSLVGVPSPATAIRRIINGLRDKIYAGVDWLLEKFKKLAMKAGGAVKATALAGVGYAKSVAGKITGLIFPKKTFAVGTEQHFIEVHESQGEFPIVIHSIELSVSELIQKARDKRLKETANLQEAYEKYSNVKVEQINLEDKRQREDPEKRKRVDAEGKKKLEEYEKVAPFIIKVMQKLSLLAGPKCKTNILYGPEKGNLGGTMMVAHPLVAKDLGGGTPTRDDVPLIMVDKWIGDDERKSQYKRGHLLNKDLGGPGHDARNITPLSTSANALHYSRAEKLIKELVPDAKLVHYEVHVNYPDFPRDTPRGASPTEGKFAISLSTKWFALKVPEAGDCTKLTQDTEKPREGSAIIPNVPPYPHL